MVIAWLLLWCMVSSGVELATAYKLEPRVVTAIQSVAKSEIQKIGITNDMDHVMGIGFYCKKDEEARQGVLYFNEDVSEVGSYMFFHTDRQLREGEKLCSESDSLSKIISKIILNILLKEGIRVTDIQDIEIDWSSLWDGRYIRGHILLDDDGNAISNHFATQ